MRVRTVQNREDYREYKADKMLYEAYKTRDQVQATHSMKQLILMWAEWYREQREGSEPKR